MRKPLTQLPLDFGGEEAKPSPPVEGNGLGSQQDGQYLSTPGVGVRVKAYKKPSATPSAADADLFPGTPATAGNANPELPAAQPESVAGAEEAPEISLTAEPAPTVASTAEPIPTIEASHPVTATAMEPATAFAAEPAGLAEEPATLAEPAPAPLSSAKPRLDAATARPRPAAAAKSNLKAGPSKRGRKSLKQVTAEADLIEIPADEVLFTRQYYTMGEVSVMFKVNQSLLRYWETEFDVLQPRKNKKGDRYFRPVDIKNLHLIYHLLRQKKYTIEGAKDFLRNNKKAKERFEIIQRLQQIRNFLIEWKAQL